MAGADRGPIDAVGGWAASGLLSLSGRSDGRGSGPPAALVAGVHRFAADIARTSALVGREVLVDPLALMAERAAVSGLTRGGLVSCGRATRLMRSRDGWVAATVARSEDWELLPALLERPSSSIPAGGWTALEAGVEGMDSEELRDRSALLGLALAVLGERRAETSGRLGPRHAVRQNHPDRQDSVRQDGAIHGIRHRRVGSAPAVVSGTELVVADLSALWAGPLAARLLGDCGARVIKVESTSRPDGARRGVPGFYRLLNRGKASVALDFDAAEGRRRLAQLVSRADVVITACRPRALEQLGLDPDAITGGERPKVWLMITGYGTVGASATRVAFGDDAAVAGGLVGWDGHTPCFCGDAIADPLTGLGAAASVLGALVSDGAWVIEASMADIAGGLAGPPLAVDDRAPSLPRVGDRPDVSVATLGADTARIMDELGIAGAEAAPCGVRSDSSVLFAKGM
jgi:hypothetical protein